MPKKMRRFLCLLLCCLWMLTGCGMLQEKETKVVLTTGFDKDEVFRIETALCYLPEIMVYLTNTQNQYESIYGEKIWKTNLRGVTLEENIKDTVLARLAQIKVMNLLAEKYQVTLSEAEKEMASQAAEEYYGTLTEEEIKGMGVTPENIESMYREYALAEKVYRFIIKDINPEISDDEARTITIEHILIKTYTLDNEGQRVPFTEAEKKAARERAEEALEKAKKAETDEEFEKLISEYNEDSRSIYSFGMGEMEREYETAAFDLGTNEISDIVETSYGYHIIKCLSTFNREETDANKVKIVEQRRKEVFSQEYDAFAASLTRSLNEEVWDSVKLIHGDNVTTTGFFQTYEKYFS